MPERTKPDFGGESDKAWYELDRRDSLRRRPQKQKDWLTALLETCLFPEKVLQFSYLAKSI